MAKGDSLDWCPDPVKGYPRYLADADAPALGDNNDDSNKQPFTSRSDKENFIPSRQRTESTQAHLVWLAWLI